MSVKEAVKPVTFRSPKYGYTVTLWPEKRAMNNLTNSMDIVEGPRIARFHDVGIGGEFIAREQAEIDRLRELCEKDPINLYEVKTGQEHLTTHLPARKPGQTYRGGIAPRGDMQFPGDVVVR